MPKITGCYLRQSGSPSAGAYEGTRNPGKMDLVRDFVNTRDLENGTDRIDAPPRLSSWMIAKELAPEGPALTDQDVARVRKLREALRSMLLASFQLPQAPSRSSTTSRVRPARVSGPRKTGASRCPGRRGAGSSDRSPARDRHRGARRWHAVSVQGLRRVPSGALRPHQVRLGRLVRSDQVRSAGALPPLS